MGAGSAAPANERASVRRRWLVVVGSLIIGMAVAFGVGSAVKKTSTTTPAAGSPKQPIAPNGQAATVTTLNVAAAIPALKSPPKPKRTSTTTASHSTGGASTSAQSTVGQGQPTQAQSPPQTQAPPPQTQAPPPQTQAPPPQTQAPPRTQPPPTTTTVVVSGG